MCEPLRIDASHCDSESNAEEWGGLRWAVPSFVVPDTVAGNVRFLEGRVPEVALCLFETIGCLAYTANDMPSPDSTQMRFHAHLPIDLDWTNPIRAADAALAVLNKADGLGVELAVLHPPVNAENPSELLRTFLGHWISRSSVRLLLENIEGAPLADLASDLFSQVGFGVCLDVGHLLAFQQDALLDSPLPARAELLHWSAPCGKDRHRPLGEFSSEELSVARRVMQTVPSSATHLIEVFNWQGVVASLPHLRSLWALRENRI